MPGMDRRGWIVAAIVASSLIAGCGIAPPQARIDGWPVGPLVDCQPPAARCARHVEAALEDPRLVALPATELQTLVAATVVYEMDLVDEVNNAIHGQRSGGGGEYVVVFGPKDAQIVVGTWCGAGIEPDICGVWDTPPW